MKKYFKMLAAVSVLVWVSGCGKPAVQKNDEMRSWPSYSSELLGTVTLNKSFGDFGHNDPIVPSVNLRTKWRDGKLYYIFQIIPVTELLNTERSKMVSFVQFRFQLIDRDGFIQITRTVDLREMVLIEAAQTSAASLEFQGSVDCSIDSYRSLSDWKVYIEGLPKS